MAARLWGSVTFGVSARRVTRWATGLLAVVVMTAASVPADVVLQGMPRYNWWSGCVPTSAGMIFGYWNDPGLYPFYDGDATVWSGASYSSNPANNKPSGSAEMVGSWGHVHEGDVAGYQTSIGEGRWTPDLREADCIADFMGTNKGATSAFGALYGIEAFARWDNPDTPDVNESVKVTTEIYWTDHDPNPWDILTAEIDVGRPSLVLVRAGTYGHAVAAYGYTDTGFMAVNDTWTDGVHDAPVGSYIDGNGVEWWPWNPTWTPSGPYSEMLDGSALVDWVAGDVDYGAMNWTVDGVITFYAKAQPEPGTMALVLVGVGGLAAWRRRRSSRAS